MAKRPRKEIIIFGLHQHNEERDVCTLASAIAIEVRPEAETVAMRAGVERRTIERDSASNPSLTLTTREVVYLPNVETSSSLHFEDLYLEVELFEHVLVLGDGICDVVEIVIHLSEGPFVLLNVSHKPSHNFVQLSIFLQQLLDL